MHMIVVFRVGSGAKCEQWFRENSCDKPHVACPFCIVCTNLSNVKLNKWCLSWRKHKCQCKQKHMMCRDGESMRRNAPPKSLPWTTTPICDNRSVLQIGSLRPFESRHTGVKSMRQDPRQLEPRRLNVPWCTFDGVGLASFTRNYINIRTSLNSRSKVFTSCT